MAAAHAYGQVPGINYVAACASHDAFPKFLLYRVQQQSMEPLLEPVDILLIDTAGRDPIRGEVVTHLPAPGWAQGDGTPFVKRVIGVENDTIEIRDGQVFLNGTQLNEPYVYEGEETVVTGAQSSWQALPATTDRISWQLSRQIHSASTPRRSLPNRELGG